MQKILIPFDFSDYSEYALKFARDYAIDTKSKIKLLHVIEHHAYGGISASGEMLSLGTFETNYLTALLKDTKERLKQKVSEKEYEHIDITFEVIVGVPFRTIISEITNYEADLIVMGTKGCSGLEELFIGSNAEKVVRFAKCPVITIPASTDFNKIRKIAFAINFESEQKLVVPFLKMYQKILQAELNLVWVNTLHIIEDEKIIDERLEDFAKTYNLDNYKVHSIKGITPEDGILNFSVQKEMDMIALATHGFKGLTHLFLGSIAEDIVNHSLIPVMTFSLKGNI